MQKGQMLIWIILGALVITVPGAYYLGTLKSKPSYQNPVITSQTPQPTPDETSNWQIYRNVNLGFLVKYPPYLGVDDRGSDGRVHISKDDEDFSVAVIDRGNSRSLQEVIRGLYEDNGTANTRNPKYITKTIMLDGVAATEYFGCAGVEGCQDTYFVLAEKDNKIYQISYNLSYSRSNIYNQILSTFKFLDQNAGDTTNWKSYINSKLGFSFKYPDNYFKYQEESSVGIYLAPSKGEGGNGSKFLKADDTWLDATVELSNVNSIDEYLDLQSQGHLYANAQKTPTTINGVYGYKVKYSFAAITGNVTIYNYEGIVLRNGKIYKITLSAWSSDILQSNKSVFDQILSTFKFQ